MFTKVMLLLIISNANFRLYLQTKRILASPFALKRGKDSHIQYRNSCRKRGAMILIPMRQHPNHMPLDVCWTQKIKKCIMHMCAIANTYTLK